MRGTLARFFGRSKLDFRLVEPSEYTHCIIDVQKQFCDPSFSRFGTPGTDRIARTIQSIAPVFRAAGMPTYMIYYKRWNETPENAFGGFHRVSPAPGDILFGKTAPSAFEYTDLAAQFNKAGTRTLLVSGFDIENCVNATVQDALRANFKVWVMRDCIGNGGPPCDKSAYIQLMRDNGAEIISSAEAIRRLRAANSAPRAI